MAGPSMMRRRGTVLVIVIVISFGLLDRSRSTRGVVAEVLPVRRHASGLQQRLHRSGVDERRGTAGVEEEFLDPVQGAARLPRRRAGGVGLTEDHVEGDRGV